jgi:hypothetical protein
MIPQVQNEKRRKLMNKRLLVSFGVTAALMLMVYMTPVSALSVSAATSVAGAADQALPLSSSRTQRSATSNFDAAYLNEAQVVFVLACRCSPAQLPQ